MDRLLEIGQRHGIPIIEDAAQAHGARYRGRSVGGHGVVGCFSFNQEKLIAAGEGGAIVTRDRCLYERMHAIRTDGFVQPTGVDQSWLPYPAVQGANYCMSEFQAAILIAQLSAFASLNGTRAASASALERALTETTCLRPLASSPGTDRRAYYEFGFVVPPEFARGWPLTLLAAALTAELGTEVRMTDPPVQASPQIGLRWQGKPPPAAVLLRQSLLLFDHWCLLHPDSPALFMRAIHKVRDVIESVPTCEINHLVASALSVPTSP
jgi:dTDP-4-amino-4,6-dideoxygalactose transaminase